MDVRASHSIKKTKYKNSELIPITAQYIKNYLPVEIADLVCAHLVFSYHNTLESSIVSGSYELLLKKYEECGTTQTPSGNFQSQIPNYKRYKLLYNCSIAREMYFLIALYRKFKNKNVAVKVGCETNNIDFLNYLYDRKIIRAKKNMFVISRKSSKSFKNPIDYSHFNPLYDKTTRPHYSYDQMPWRLYKLLALIKIKKCDRTKIFSEFKSIECGRDIILTELCYIGDKELVERIINEYYADKNPRRVSRNSLKGSEALKGVSGFSKGEFNPSMIFGKPMEICPQSTKKCKKCGAFNPNKTLWQTHYPAGFCIISKLSEFVIVSGNIELINLFNQYSYPDNLRNINNAYTLDDYVRNKRCECNITYNDITFLYKIITEEEADILTKNGNGNFVIRNNLKADVNDIKDGVPRLLIGKRRLTYDEYIKKKLSEGLSLSKSISIASINKYLEPEKIIKYLVPQVNFQETIDDDAIRWLYYHMVYRKHVNMQSTWGSVDTGMIFPYILEKYKAKIHKDFQSDYGSNINKYINYILERSEDHRIIDCIYHLAKIGKL